MYSGISPISPFWQDSQALGDGLLFGDDTAFSYELRAVVKAVGVTHLVAASGSNLSFVEALFAPRLVSQRWLKEGIRWLSILWYNQMVGESGSLWRATLMWIFRAIGILYGRPISFLRIIIFTTFITSILRPSYLTNDGFILSILAIGGVHFSQVFSGRENNDALLSPVYKWRRWWWQNYRTGWVVLLFVSLWLWGKYQVFEPMGVIMTLLLQVLVPPMIWLSWWRHVFQWCGADQCLTIANWFSWGEWFFFQIVWRLLQVGYSLNSSPRWGSVIRGSLMISGGYVVGCELMKALVFYWKNKQLSCITKK